MDFQDNMFDVLNTLPQEQKEQLQAIEVEDKDLFKEILLEMLRLSIMVKTGNTHAWEKWKKEQEENLASFFRELEDAEKIDSLKKRLSEM